MKVTIKDVVKKSGLSYVTVSRVISNDPNVREDNRKRVLEAIDELGYVPSAAARTLATGKTHVIAMFISEIVDDFFAAMIKEVNAELLQRGYLLTLTICEDQAEEVDMSFLSQNRVDGAILLVPNKEKYYIDILQARKLPFVVIDNQTVSNEITSIMTDNVTGGYIATKHLIELGHKQIGFIGADPYTLSTMERHTGAIKAMTEVGLKPYSAENGAYDQSTGYEAVMKWNHKGSMPTAIFAFDDNIALGAINAIKDLGLTVPTDISVCGYDNSRLAKSFEPKITSVMQPSQDIAKYAVEQLMDMIDTQQNGAFAMKFPPKMDVKASTAKYNP